MRLLAGLLIAMFGAAQGPAPVVQPPPAADVLAQLSRTRLDKKQIYNIRDITIRRDVLSVALNRGTIAFLEPVQGKVTGAVFIGSGEVVAVPPDAIEKQQVFRFTGSPVLNEPFSAAVFRFTDGTYEEILKEYAQHAAEDVSAADSAQFLPWDQTLTDRFGLLDYRILADLMEPGDRPLFFAELNGDKAGWFDIIYDPRLVEEVVVARAQGAANSPVSDIWTSFNRRSEARNPEAASHEYKSSIDILSYDIDAAISAGTQAELQATMKVQGLVDGARVVGFGLSGLLRVSSVATVTGEAVPFYQASNITVIVLPQPLRAGQEAVLRFTYAGEVREKDVWYPSLGQQDNATFNLTFHYPLTSTLVATGNKVKEWEEAGRRHAVWTSDADFAPARFTAGDFKILSDDTAPLPIYVPVSYVPANNDVETPAAPGRPRRNVQTPQPAQPAATVSDEAKSRAEALLREVRAAVNYFSGILGPYPYEGMYVSTSDARDIAHQWFWNKVGWSSYHDYWIPEGYSSYAAAIYLQDRTLADARLRLIKESAGPVSLGTRIGGQSLIDKSIWVLHMLRMSMREDGPNPDAAFWRMTREFLQAYKGARASMWDFKHMAEKYMTKAMDLRDDRKLDWFFDQWVFGTGIPAYSLDYKVDAAQNGFVIQGTIKQSGVADTFIMSIPVYADDDLLGRVVVSDEDGSFRFTVRKKPERVLMDPQGTLLWKNEN